jgi:hypothetical protein
VSGLLPENYAIEQFPIRIYDGSGEMIDCAGNVESAESILYGDLSQHDGTARTIYAPDADMARLAYLAGINADCFGIPVDNVLSLARLDELVEGMKP